MEHHANRGHAQSNSHAQAYPMEAETTMSTESNHYHNHKAASDTESDQLDWDPGKIDDDGYPLVDENGSTLVPIPREGPLDEDEASSVTAWAQGYREVRKNLRDSVTGRGHYKPESSPFKNVVRKTMFEKKPPRRDRNIRTPFRDKARDHSKERVAGAELRTQHRRTLSNLQPRISFCQEMPLHNCIICHPTCCLMVRPRLLWEATLI